MTKSQNTEFTIRIMTNVERMMAKGVSKAAAEKAVFEEMNMKFPMALASWMKVNG